MRQIGGKETIKHVIFDGNNLLHKANYVYITCAKTQLSSKDGYPTGLIYGSISIASRWLRDILKDDNGSKVIVSFFFDGIPKRRLDIDSSYKSDKDFLSKKVTFAEFRPESNPKKLNDGFEASCEVEVLAHALDLIGCDVYHHPYEEADDLIASFVKKQKDTTRIIVSDDKDLFQLLSDPRVIIYRPSVKDDRFFDAEKAEEHWGTMQSGKHPKVPVSHVRMFKALCGDPSDDITGVRMLRKKVAIELCGLPDVEAVYASGFKNFSKAEKETALSCKEKIEKNFQLVGFFDDLDVDSCKISRGKNHEAANRLFEELNVKKLSFHDYRVTSSKTDDDNVFEQLEVINFNA